MKVHFPSIALGAITALVALPLLTPTRAEAAPAACPTTQGAALTYATVFPTSGTWAGCTLGDKLFSNFASPSSALAGLSNKPKFWWDDPVVIPTGLPGFATLNWGYTGNAVAGPFFPGTPSTNPYSFEYKVTVDAAYPLIRIIELDANFTGSGGSRMHSLCVKGTTKCGDLNGGYMLDPTLKSGTFTTTAYYTGTPATLKARYWSDSFLQDQVPGPLPLGAAAMAFGYSRKLRTRVRKLA